MDAGTEAASEMVTYIPSMKALWTGELTYQRYAIWQRPTRRESS